MSGPLSISQFDNVISVLVNHTDWDALDGDVLQKIIDNPKEAGAQFTEFLRNKGRLINEHSKPNILRIDRSVGFAPCQFLGKGWTIAEEDERSIALSDLDLSQVRLEHMLNPCEQLIDGVEKLARLKEAGHVRLDARIFQALWENQHLIPESWKKKTNRNTTFIFFHGTILRSPLGGFNVLCLYWHNDEWRWFCHMFDDGWFSDGLSAVLASGT